MEEAEERTSCGAQSVHALSLAVRNLGAGPIVRPVAYGRSMTEHEYGDLAPLRLFEYDHRPGHYCLMLTDDAMVPVEDVFAKRGYEGCGYGWAGVARVVVRKRMPEVEERLGFDPEAGMFVAYGEDADALRRLGAELRKALADRAVLAGLIEAGEPEWFD